MFLASANLVSLSLSAWIRAKTRVKNIVQVFKKVLKQKWRWTGHIARMNTRWTKRITDWCPYNDRRS